MSEELRKLAPKDFWEHVTEELGMVLLEHGLLPSTRVDDTVRSAEIDFRFDHFPEQTVLKCGEITVTLPRAYLEDMLQVAIDEGVEVAIAHFQDGA